MTEMPALRALSTPSLTALAIAIGIILSTLLLQRKLSISPEPGEPPFVPATVPWMGHVVGLFRHGKRYFKMIEYCRSLE